MAKLEDIDPNLDPIVRAAMIDDDDPEDTTSDDKSLQATDDDSNEEPEEEESPKEDQEEGNEVVEDRSTEKEEVEDEDTETEEGQPEQKLTRKEKREQKRQRYLDSIRKEGEQTSRGLRTDLFGTDPNYQPLQYDENTELDVKTLQQDREKYGQTNFNKGAQLAQSYAEQDKFWTAVEYEDKLLQTDPKFSFLNPNSKKYDEDKAADLHELFFEVIGFNQDTNMARRTDISFEKFVKAEVKRMERWSSKNEGEIIKNANAQRSTAGIRPSGSPSKSLGKIKPGDISRMSQEEFEKNEAEIDRQILAELGQ